MTVMGKIGKIKHLIALGISICIISLSYIYIFSLKDQNEIMLEDMAGDRSALSDIVITAYLQDIWHGRKIMIDKGELSERFIYYEKEADRNDPPIRYGNGAADDKYSYWYSYSYEISNDANTVIENVENKITIPVRNDESIEAVEKTTIIYADKIDIYMEININDLLDESGSRSNSVPEKNRIRFKTGMSVKRDNPEFVFERSRIIYDGGGRSEQGLSFKSRNLVQPYNDFALTTIGNDQYFIVTNRGDDYLGESSIFKAVEYADSFSFLSSGDREYGRVEKLVSLDRTDDRSYVLGLHAVNGTLIAAMVEDNIPVFKAYDPETGEQVGKLSITDFTFDSDDRGWMYYLPFIKDNTLTLSYMEFDRSIYDTGVLERQSSFNILSIEYERNRKAFKLLNLIKGYELNGSVVSGINTAVPANGKLVVAATLRKGDNGEAVTSSNEYSYPPAYMIYVFEDELKYCGKIVTDVYDDVKAYSNINIYERSFGYNYYQNRTMGLVKVEGVK